MRAAIACGGTGGHFYPGYVLGKTLMARGHEVLFILRREDPAAGRLEAEDLSFTEIDLRGMPRRLSFQWPGFLWKLAASLRVAGNILDAFRPSVVAGMGGYLTFPLAWAARRRNTPLLLHESNSVLGLANRTCLPWASALALGLPLDRPPRTRALVELTGTPVRPELTAPLPRAQARSELGLEPDKPVLLVFGGSQGARAINRAVPASLALLAGRRPDSLQVLHLTGPADEGPTRDAYSGLRLHAQVRPFLPQMHLAYAAADLALCRAGASTLAELAAVRKPALLIPYPSAADNHQEANARLLERSGAGEVLLEAALTPEGLAARLESLLLGGASSPLTRMGQAYSGLQLPSQERVPAALADLVEKIVA